MTPLAKVLCLCHCTKIATSHGALMHSSLLVLPPALPLSCCSSMTPLSKVLMLPAEASYDQALLDEVLDNGHSRCGIEEDLASSVCLPFGLCSGLARMQTAGTAGGGWGRERASLWMPCADTFAMCSGWAHLQTASLW
jgi:hypothetical protein